MIQNQSTASVLQANNLKPSPLPKKQLEKNCVYKTTSLKIDNLNVHIKSYFYPQKSLYDILFSIANTRLKERPA